MKTFELTTSFITMQWSAIKNRTLLARPNQQITIYLNGRSLTK